MTAPNRGEPTDRVVVSMSQRISSLGNEVVREIADRLKVDPKIVLRAMLNVALHHQRELTEAIDELRGVDFGNW